MELKSYLIILWRRKLVIAIASAVAIVVTVIGTMMMTPKYETSTTLRIATANRGSIDWVDYDVEYTERLMNTYAKIAVSDPVVAELTEQLDLDHPPKIEVDILANTELMKITIEDPDPVVAAQIANLVAEILIAQSKGLDTGDNKTTLEVLNEQLLQLEQELELNRQAYDALVRELPEDSERVTTARRSLELREARYTTLLDQYEQARTRAAVQVNTLTVIEPALTPLKPSKPRWEINIALSVIIGLAGGLGLAFLFENLDTTLYNIDQIETFTNSPILGQIPTSTALPRIALDNVSPHTEAIRRLRTNILLRDNAGPLQTIAITSAEPGEGKSTIIANLAWAMAQTGRKVILIDGDMRLPTLHQIFDLPNTVGLSNVLNETGKLEEALQSPEQSGLQILTSGPFPSNPAELLGAPQMAALLEQLRKDFDLVLLDTPALLAVTDAAVLAPGVDGVALIISQAKARKETVRSAYQYLDNVNVKLIGVVVNRINQGNTYGGYYTNQPDEAVAVSGELSKLRALSGKPSFSGPNLRHPLVIGAGLLVAAVITLSVAGYLSYKLLSVTRASISNLFDTASSDRQTLLQLGRAEIEATVSTEGQLIDDTVALPAISDASFEDTQSGLSERVVKPTETEAPETVTPLSTSTLAVIAATDVIAASREGRSNDKTIGKEATATPAPTLAEASATAAVVTSTNRPNPTSTPTARPTATRTASPTTEPTATSKPSPTPTPTFASAPVSAPQPANLIKVQSNRTGHDLDLLSSHGEFIRSVQIHGAAPAWSPDASRVAFFGESGISDLGGVYQQGNGVWVIDAWQEKEPTLLIIIDHIKNLAWSFNGLHLTFEVDAPGANSEIGIIDATSGQEISRFPGQQPSWSPDNQKLVIKNCWPDCGLWLVNPDGSGGQQITFDGTDSYPVWSPNGKYIIFSSRDRDNDWEIYQLQMAGNTPQGEPQRLTNRAGVDTTPVVSPDSREIYLRTNALGGWRITAIELNGGNERLVAEGVGPSEDWGLARPAAR